MRRRVEGSGSAGGGSADCGSADCGREESEFFGVGGNARG